MILIGCSTGGPKALQEVLAHLKRDEHTSLLVVQHMPPAFTSSLANRLHQISAYDVKEGSNGEVLQGGTVYIAPGGKQMEIRALHKQLLVLHIYESEALSIYKPSLNVLYKSAAVIEDSMIMTVTLTGMGKDGRDGLQHLNATRRTYNIAEHASTSVVYGMPKAVIETDLIDEVVPLDAMHQVLNQWIERDGG